VKSPTFEALQAASRSPSGIIPPAGVAPNCFDPGGNATVVPPPRGPSLARRLALLTTLIVTGTMAAMSGAQLWLDLREEWMQHEKRLRESLAPLVAELGSAPTSDQAHEALRGFHRAYSDQGYPDHQLSVIDDSGRTRFASATSVDPGPQGGPDRRGRVQGACARSGPA
jgi:hypothetical protein